MQFEEVMRELEALGTEQNRKIYRKHEVKNEVFGVSFANFKVLTKKIKKDHDLATKLWATQNYDAQTLATMIADPAQITAEIADAWAKDVNDYTTAGQLSDLISKSPTARAKAEEWAKSDEEYLGSIGWKILARLAMNDAELPDTYFAPYLKVIESDIHEQKNRKREAMNGAMIAIGGRIGLRENALLTAKNVGKVSIDHGDTGCKTPAAAEYIMKVAARKEGTATK